MAGLVITALSLANVALATDEVTTDATGSTATGSVTTNNAAGLREQRMKDIEARRAEMQKNGQAIRDQRAEMQNGRQELKDQRQENREQNVEQKCAMIQAKITERNSKFEENKDKHTAVYTNMKERISKFITRLSGEGYDVSKIQADLGTLDGKISKLEADLATQNSKMNETKDFACGHSDGDFKGKLGEARIMMQAIRQEAMEVRQFVQTTLRPDIQALRKQKIEAKKDSQTPNPPIAGNTGAAVIN